MKNRLNGHANGKPKELAPIPEGGFQISEDVIRYEVYGAHWYLHVPTREWMTSVTKPLRHFPKGPQYEEWHANQGGYQNVQRIMEEAGKRGRAVHSGIHSLLKGIPLKRREFDHESWTHLMSFKRWFEDVKPVIYTMEEVVYDTRRKIAGTLDIACELEGVPTILDVKTGKYLYDSNRIQVNEYAKLWEAMGNGPKIEQVALLRTGSKHKCGYEFWKDAVSEERHTVFRALQYVEKFIHPETEPRFGSKPPDELSIDV